MKAPQDCHNLPKKKVGGLNQTGEGRPGSLPPYYVRILYRI